MANDNKSMGRFSWNDIPPARRGVPQIEVRFDIDANGIVHVSAKDLGTGKQQDITISGNNGFSDDEIERMVKDAEMYKDEDDKRKEAVEIRNGADALVYQVEQSLSEVEGKISDDEMEQIKDGKAALEEALKGEDTDDIKAKSEALSEVFYKISEKMYQAAAAEQQAAGGEGAYEAPKSEDDNVVEADYTVVDEDNK